MRIEDKIIYTKTRLVGARLVNCKEDIETYTQHLKELEKEKNENKSSMGNV